ncbi:winged helix-turn-helix domain-containing protein [Amycolatopsis oliviviridis]|uniref:Transcriptional regulator n=1 Tax=Amycolatopsis oliviviridis TaxID=1471590 RepID=A0ABQ3LEL0_9PSEU|nr:winged helix-turn-helix domain-containing protein [Amycolatopsis oliviviridis]GHH06205.1 transcriptional regulator [Amycolatopsis oliviviridis]
MLKIHFTPEDLARTRISAAPQPMWEVLLSVYRLRGREGGAIFEEWRRSVAQAAHVTTRLLADLAPQSGYAVDFITPTLRNLSLSDGLEALRRTPKQRLKADLTVLAGHRRLPAWTSGLAEGRPETLTRLADSVERYFAACLAPYWVRICGRVEQERARQVKMMTEEGCEHLLARVHPTARWNYPVLELDYPVDQELRLNGRGLCLAPSFFCWGLPTTFLDGELEPTLVYPIEHKVGWSVGGGTGRPLTSLLGRTRARVLEVIGERPGTTTEVASRTETSLPTASQQAATLREAGLITSCQNGQSVLHSITPLGLALLAEG